MTLPKKKLKVSELAVNKDRYTIIKESSKNSYGTLKQYSLDEADTVQINWDIHSVGSSIKFSKETNEVSIGDSTEGRFQNAVCSSGFDSGIISWVLEVTEKRKGDVRVGLCKTKILNNDECFSNFAIGFAVGSDGFCKNGANFKSRLLLF